LLVVAAQWHAEDPVTRSNTMAAGSMIGLLRRF
jgi:hypothetical protein